MTHLAPRRRDLGQAVWPSPRQSIWTRIRQLGAGGATFTRRQLWYSGREEPKQVEDFIRDLVKGGFLAIAGKQHNPSTVSHNASTENLYRLVNDVGFDAPRLGADGRLVTAGRKTEQLWQTIRMLSHFTAHDLATDASVDDSVIGARSANNYCVILAKAGYLQIVQKAVPKRKKSTVYRLIKARNTGPKAPYLRHFVDAVWDPNLNKIAWYSQETEGGGPRRRRQSP